MWSSSSSVHSDGTHTQIPVSSQRGYVCSPHMIRGSYYRSPEDIPIDFLSLKEDQLYSKLCQDNLCYRITHFTPLYLPWQAQRRARANGVPFFHPNRYVWCSRLKSQTPRWDIAQFRVLRQKGTEAPGTGEYEKFKGQGIYTCAGCGTPLYKSSTKFDSGCGWPAFFDGR